MPTLLKKRSLQDDAVMQMQWISGVLIEVQAAHIDR
jgi:hypothetical protein